MVPFVINLRQAWLSRENITIFCNKIHERGAPFTNCWGFDDGTVRPICRPERNQHVLYNGYKKVHGNKFQSVAATNVLVHFLFIWTSRRAKAWQCYVSKIWIAANVRALFHSPRLIYTVHLWRSRIPVETTTLKTISANTDNFPSKWME